MMMETYKVRDTEKRCQHVTWMAVQVSENVA